MKKYMVVIIIVLGALSILYFFSGTKKTITLDRSVKMNGNAVFRKLSDTTSWSEWWPHSVNFVYKGHTYKIKKVMFNAFEIIIHNEDTVQTTLQLIPITIDSTLIQWSGNMKEKDKFSRFRFKRKMKQLQTHLEIILDNMKSYLEDQRKVYGFLVKEVRVTDSVLISMKKTFPHYPDQEEVGSMINMLREYIRIQQSNEVNYPMLNIRKAGNLSYETMVAIPVDRELKATSLFLPKVVLKGGKLLEVEVTGGPETIKGTFRSFDQFIQDYQKIPPAIPYQLLITDRLKEKDTSKWITRLYYPVF